MTAAQRLALARAEKRLIPMVARDIESGGLTHQQVLDTMRLYEAEYRAGSVPPVEQWPDSVIDRTFRDIVAMGIGEVA